MKPLNNLFTLAIVAVAPAAASDYLVGAGKAYAAPNAVATFNSDGTPTGVNFMAYGADHWGTGVAGASVLWTPTALTGPGPGGIFGPHTRAFRADTGQPISGVNFYAYGTLRFGVNVGAARLDTSSESDTFLTGAGGGAVFGPHVRGWVYDGARTRAFGGVNFYAYFTLRWGVNVAGGDIEGDLVNEIVTAPGPGPVFAPTVRAYNYDGGPLTTTAKVNFDAFQERQYGGGVSIGEHDGDSAGEISVSRGPGPPMPAQIRGFNYDGAAIGAMGGFDITPFPSVYGAGAGAGWTPATWGLLLAGAGPDPTAAAVVKTYAYDGSKLDPAVSFSAFAYCCGVNPVGSR